MQKFWLDSYPPGVPEHVQADRFPSLNAMLKWVCERYRDQSAFTNQGATISWLQLDKLSRDFAAYLQGPAGVRKGDRVALMMPNLLQYPVALLGALRAGCVLVNTNPMYTARELNHQLVDSGATAVVVLDNFAHTLEQALPGTQVAHVITTRVGDMLHFPKAQIVNLVVKYVMHMVPAWHIDGAVPFGDALSLGAGLPLSEANPGPDDIAFLQYTGGTTGVPKGAILTHGNLVANVEQTTAWVADALDEGKELAVVPLPLYHVFALTVTFALCRLGAQILLITNPRDMHGFIKELKHNRFTVLIGVNTLFNAMLNAPGIEQVDKGTLKLAVAGGMAVQRPVADRWQQLFGVPLVEGYGLSEASPIVTANPLKGRHFTGMIGLPIPSTDVAMLDDAGSEVPPGEVGEICVRGPQVMKGYWNMPEETAATFTADGWLRTGDLGIMNQDGYIKLVDRKKDVINVSGFNVYPNEVEDVVAMHPAVLEVAAIREPDEHSGEAVKVVVVTKDPRLTAEALLEHCKRNLAAYKVPKDVVIRSEPLPKSSIGKVLRRAVAEEEARGAVAAPAHAG